MGKERCTEEEAGRWLFASKKKDFLLLPCCSSAGSASVPGFPYSALPAGRETSFITAYTHHPQMLGCFETPEGYFSLKMSFSSSWAVLPTAHGVGLGVSSDSAGCF